MPRILQRDIPRKGLFKRRRVAVVVVPSVEELDLVVFSASNRLAGKLVSLADGRQTGSDRNSIHAVSARLTRPGWPKRTAPCSVSQDAKSTDCF